MPFEDLVLVDLGCPSAPYRCLLALPEQLGLVVVELGLGFASDRHDAAKQVLDALIADPC